MLFFYICDSVLIWIEVNTKITERCCVILLKVKAEAALAADRFVSVFDIHVDAQDGQVTLTGTVDNFAQRDHAELLMKGFSEVERIKNRLKVGTDREPEHVDTSSLLDQMFPVITEDQRRVVEKKVQDALRTDIRFASSEITVTVNRKGTAKLTGRVGSMITKRLAENVVWAMPGVNYVINSILSEGEEAESSEGKAAKVMKSALASAKLKALLLAHDAVSHPFRPGLESDGDTVALVGDVDNYAERDIVEGYAESMYEDKTIENQLTVGEETEVRSEPLPNPSGPELAGTHPYFPHAVQVGERPYTAGGYLAQPVPLIPGRDGTRPSLSRSRLNREHAEAAVRELEAALANAPLLETFDVGCSIDSSGTVYLTGSVENVEAARKAEELAWRTRGVDHVVNKLMTA